MKRIWLFVLLGVLWLCTALSISMVTGDSIYLAWAIFLPPVLALLNMARPRRGIHYAYWNRYIYTFGGLVLGLATFPVIVGYFGLKFGVSAEIFLLLFMAWLVVFPISFFLWFKLYFMPAWGPWQIRKRYPQIAATARRLKKSSEHYTWYMPMIFVQGFPYLVVGYETQGLTGIATLDEQGRFVKDEARVETLIRCFKLAVSVLHMPASRSRAQEIESFKQTNWQMQRFFQHFRGNEAYFLAAGKRVHDQWKSICEFEENFHAISITLIARKSWQAKWAFEHGLNRLTEVSDQQLREVEAALTQFDTTLRSHAAEIDHVGADAQTLQETLPKLAKSLTTADGKSVQLSHRAVIQDMLIGLSMLRQAAVAWQRPAIEFLPLEQEWKVWRERKAMAEKFERGGML